MAIEQLGENFKEYRTVDKSKYPRTGAWNDEPDKAQWIDAATGLDCLVVRGPHGALCGYVGVPDSHALFGKGYSDVPDFDAHGGLTFADRCADTGDESRHICHVPAPGRPDHVWWFGFDCAHSGDISPSYSHEDRAYISGWEDTYKTFAYVVSRVRTLAADIDHWTKSGKTLEDTRSGEE